MRFSEAKNRDVVATDSAATVGRIDRFVVDAHQRRVVALQLSKTDDHSVLPWAGIASFGADAVTVDSIGRLGELDEETAPWAEKARRILGKRVLSTAGDELGEVGDVEFDPRTGEVRALMLEKGSEAEVPGSSLVGLGSYAAVVELDQ